MKDRFYTPPEIAALVAEKAIGGRKVDSAADFAIGGGALMEELAARQPAASVFGTDIDARAVHRLRAKRPKWALSQCDFLNPRSRQRARVTREARRFDAIALNPPYSHRGGATARISLAGEAVSCSPAAAFLGLATTYAHPSSRIAALLPKGSLASDKDAGFWEAIRREWLVRETEEFGRGWLPGTHTAVALVTLSRGSLPIAEASDEATSDEARGTGVRIVRGCTPVFKVHEESDGVPFIHTTGLTRDGLVSTRVRATSGRVIRGPAVLLPRVGSPVVWKVQVYLDSAPLLMSDCVIGLECEENADALRIAELASKGWNVLQKAWSGSCAPYVTIARLRHYLALIGIGTTYSGADQSRRY